MATRRTEQGKIGLIEVTDESDVGILAAERMGYENGKQGIPKEDHVGLDVFERKVQAYYSRIIDFRNRGYLRELKELAERVDERLLQGASTQHDRSPDYDLETELAESSLWQIVEANAHELEDLQRKTQDATDELHAFKIRNDLQRDPVIPKDRLNSLWYIVVFLFVETFVNATAFFDLENVPGGGIGALTEAAGISIINVGMLACAAGLLVRRIRYKALHLRAAAWSGLIFVLLLALAWNLAAGHYRDALEGAEAPQQCEAVQSGAILRPTLRIRLPLVQQQSAGSRAIHFNLQGSAPTYCSC